MQILPAIDLLEGKVVRLFQGDYNQPTFYSHRPSQIAETFVAKGYPFLHVIDLAGAKAGAPQATKEIDSILELGISIQVGGGIRTFQHASDYLTKGVKRIIIGTQALINPSFTDELIQSFGPESIMVSVDVREGKPAINGWLQDYPLSLEELLSRLTEQHVNQIILTDITRDGTLSGVSIPLYTPIVEAFPNVRLYAAGGISSHSDIELLASNGVFGAVVGKAFYETNMDI